MQSTSARAAHPVGGSALLLFVALEGIALAGFVTMLVLGRSSLALLFLAGPLQMLAWAVLLQHELVLLGWCLVAAPLVSLELLPPVYAWAVLYVGTVGILVFGRVFPSGGSSVRPITLDRVDKRLMFILGICLSVAAVHAYVRDWFSVMVVKHTVLAFSVLAVTWLTAVVPRTHAELKRLTLALSVSAVAASASLPFLPGTSSPGAMLGSKTIASVFAVVNLNAFAVVVAALAAVLLGLAVSSRSRGATLLYSLGTLALLVALVYSKSRGAWLAFGVAFLYVACRRRSRTTLVLGFVTLGGLLTFEAARQVLFSRMAVTGAQDPSLWGRFLLWRYALVVIRDNWLLGVGMQNFGHVKHAYGFPWPRAFGVSFNAHSLPLELLADLGVAGLVSFGWLSLRALVRADRAARDLSSDDGLALGLAAGLLAYLVHGLLDCVIWQDGAFMLLGILLGMNIAVWRLARQPQSGGAATDGTAVTLGDPSSHLQDAPSRLVPREARGTFDSQFPEP